MLKEKIFVPKATFVGIGLLAVFLIGILVLVVYFLTHQQIVVNVHHPPPTSGTSSPAQSAQGAIAPSPSMDADIETILTYLIQRKQALDQTYWSGEIQRALIDPHGWISQNGNFVYPKGRQTIDSLYLYYDEAVGEWNVEAY
jgi:hypothetical protein